MTAAVLVARNAERFIGPTLDSVLEQSRQPELVVIIDDGSTDGTRAAIEHAVDRRRTHAGSAPDVRVVASASTAADAVTRTASNFVQGIREASAHEVVVLGDHDDRWHPYRIAHQERLLAADPSLALLASNGRLVDAAGAGLPGSLRTAFPVPEDFASLGIAERIGYVLGHSVATGGASALRPVLLGEFLDVPRGWLHDRWWSIAATAVNAIGIDDTVVIDYVVHDRQQVGLNRGSQGAGAAARGRSKAGSGAVRRLRDVHRIGRNLPSAEAKGALSWFSIIRSALS
jgi:glycosyltransferase involved in cell wall biosynthesis